MIISTQPTPLWKEHHLAGVVDVSRDDEVAIVAVVGDGVLEASDVGSAIASRALSAAIASGVRVTLAAAGASEVAAYMLVHQMIAKGFCKPCMPSSSALSFVV